MELEELRALAAIAEQGSLSAAAQCLHLPRATLRRRIESLEAKTGAPILSRDNRSIAVTAFGLELLKQSRPLLDQASSLTSWLHARGTPTALPVRLALPPGMPPSLACQALGAVRGALPSTPLFATTSSTNHPHPAEVDVAIAFTKPHARPGWTTFELAVFRQWLVASPRYLKRRGTPKHPADLSRHTILLWSAPNSSTDSLPLLSGDVAHINPALVYDDIHLLRLMAANGQGIAFVPDGEIADPHTAEPPLVTVLEENVGDVFSLCMAVSDNARSRPEVARLVEFAQDFARKL